jgi:hypothetical protein
MHGRAVQEPAFCLLSAKVCTQLSPHHISNNITCYHTLHSNHSGPKAISISHMLVILVIQVWSHDTIMRVVWQTISFKMIIHCNAYAIHTCWLVATTLLAPALAASATVTRHDTTWLQWSVACPLPPPSLFRQWLALEFPSPVVRLTKELVTFRLQI